MNIKSEMLLKLKNQKSCHELEKINFKKQEAAKWFVHLRDEICRSFEEIENTSSNNEKTSFDQKQWKREGGGGGVISVMKGNIFEKVGVNISTVYGEFSKEFRSQIPGAETNGKFWASGISVVSHMFNPFVPAAHMNTRFLVTGEGENQKMWFGGGGDLTPIFEDLESKEIFHQNFKETCDKYNLSYYPQYKKWCDDYFYLNHRDEQRGVGGLFFDDLNEEGFDTCFEFMKSVGSHFCEAYKPIVLKRQGMSFTEKQREFQLFRRGRYVEFNLIQDRGTLFGLQSGGRTESILMSLPPLVKWAYHYNIEPNSEEEKLTSYFLKPRNWI